MGRAIDRDAVIGQVGDLLRPRLPDIIVRPRGSFSRKATLDETAIEAPFRLQVSPTSQGHWVHAAQPVPADDAPGHVELWHTRLDTGTRTEDDLLRPSRPADDETRVIRAVWARDRDDLATSDWQDGEVDVGGGLLSPDDIKTTGATTDPFLGSLDRADRHRLVRQTTEAWLGGKTTRTTPGPVGADKLWLTALGAWLDLHGQWDTMPYSERGLASILAWDHVATGGRDQFVRVVYPGYLFPLGQPTVRVKITERSIRPQTNPTAGLFQRQFLVVIDPVREHSIPGFFLTRSVIGPRVTPPLDPPGDDPIAGLGSDEAFWPRVGGKPFSFRVDGTDHDGRPAAFPAPLIWVAEQVGAPAKNSAAARAAAAKKLADLEAGYRASTRRVIDLGGQAVAFVPKDATGDARLETRQVRLLGKAAQGRSVPRLSSADVVLPAAQAIAGSGPTRITYYAPYRASGFTGRQHRPGVGGLAHPGRRRPTPTTGRTSRTDGAAPDVAQALPGIAFGGGGGAVPSDQAGGFVQPNLSIAGLSMKQGPVGDLASVAADTFKPKDFLGDALPKLFGLVELADLLPDGTLDEAPALVTDALDTLSAIEKEVERAVAIAQDAAGEAQRVLDRVQGAGGCRAGRGAGAARRRPGPRPGVRRPRRLRCSAWSRPSVRSTPARSRPPSTTHPTASGPASRPLPRPLAPWPGHRCPLFARTRLEQVAAALERFRDSTALVERHPRVPPGRRGHRSASEITFRYEWKPTDAGRGRARRPRWSSCSPTRCSSRSTGRSRRRGRRRSTCSPSCGRSSSTSSPRTRSSPSRSSGCRSRRARAARPRSTSSWTTSSSAASCPSSRRSRTSSPSTASPTRRASRSRPAGLTAGFSLTLPNLAIGVFTLSNISLGADVRVPFLGETITVGFNFCTRERPFVLSVVFLGGGGWFLIRLSPKGLEVLELGLEAGAYLAVDFGVASGSISAAIGIYIRLEGEKGSLTGYFRLRGEVDVLGLISASIELYMELVYGFDTGKMIGRARITVEVEVLCFSASVTIEAERQFAGSNGDPSLREVVMEDDGTRPRVGRLPARLRPGGGGGMSTEWFTALALPASVVDDAPAARAGLRRAGAGADLARRGPRGVRAVPALGRGRRRRRTRHARRPARASSTPSSTSTGSTPRCGRGPSARTPRSGGTGCRSGRTATGGRSPRRTAPTSPRPSTSRRSPPTRWRRSHPSSTPLTEALVDIARQAEAFRITRGGAGEATRTTASAPAATSTTSRASPPGSTIASRAVARARGRHRRPAAGPRATGRWAVRSAGALQQLHLARRFYERPESQVADQVRKDPPDKVETLPQRGPEFHERVAAAGDHPLFLERLGLVLPVRSDPARLRRCAVARRRPPARRLRRRLPLTAARGPSAARTAPSCRGPTRPTHRSGPTAR